MHKLRTRSPNRPSRPSGLAFAAAFAALIAFAAAERAAHAFACTWNSGGAGFNNWNNASKWSTCNSTFPQAGDDVTINSGTPSINVNTLNLRSLTVSGGTLTQSGTNTITVNSGTGAGAKNFTVNGGTFSGGSGSITVGADLAVSGNSTSFTATSGTTSVGGNFSRANNGTFSANTGTLQITGNVSKSGGGTFTVNGTINMVGTSGTGQITSGGTNLGTLTINGSGGTYTLQDNLSVGALTITAGTLDVSTTNNTSNNKSVTATSITVNGSGGTYLGRGNVTTASSGISVSSGTFTATTDTTTGTSITGTLAVSGGTFTGTAGKVSTTVDLTISGASTSFTAPSGTMTVGGSFNRSSNGTFSANGGTLQITGSFSNTGAGTFTANGTINLVGTSASGQITSTGANLGTLTINGSMGTYTLQDNLAVGALTVTAGTFDVSTNNRSVSATSITVNGGTYTGRAAATTASSGLTVSSGTYTASTGTTSVGGSFTHSGGTFTPSGGTLSLTGTGSINTGGTTLAAVAVSGTYSLAAALTTSGNLSITGGSLSPGAYDLSVGGTLSESAGTFTGGSGDVTIAGGLTISSTGNFTASSGTTTIGGAFNRSGTGTFNANSGTVFFNGTGSPVHTFGGASLGTVLVGLNGTTGLVRYYKLDESSGAALDSSSSGINGTLSASNATRTTSTFPTAIGGNVRSLSLTGGYVTLPVTGLPANDAAQTLSIWFKATPDGNNHNMIAMSNLSSGSAVQLGYRGANLIAWAYGGATLVSTTAPTDGNWHHVAYTYDGTTDRIYLDGNLSASATPTHQTATPTSAYLGTFDGGSELWSGNLDDARIYTRAISAYEIGLLAAGTSPSTTAGAHTFNDAFICLGDFSILAGSLAGSSPLQVGGNWLNVGTYTDTGAVTLTGTGSGQTLTTGGYALGALTVNGSGGTYTLQDNLQVTGNLSIIAGTLTGAKTIGVGGSWFNSGSYTNVGVVTLTSSSPSATITSGGGRFSSLVINGSGTYQIQDRLWVPTSTITLTNGTLQNVSSIVHVGSFSFGAGSYVAGSGTIVFDGSSSQSLPAALASQGGLRLEDPTETNLVGYWKLDEGQGRTLQDLSGNGNSGMLGASGATWRTSGVSAVPSTIGYDNYAALTFDGNNGYAQVGTNNLPATNGAITISVWVNSTDATNPGNQNFVGLVSAGGLLQVGIRGGRYTAWTSGAATLVQGATVTNGGWHHVAYTYDGSSVDTIYVDGVATTGTITHQAGATTGAYLAAYNATAGSERFNGALDDVRIYNVPLSATQIAQLAAGRYPCTGGYATTTLSANTTVSGLLALDSGSLDANGKTMSAGATGPTAAQVNCGTYTVGGVAQTFSGGLTVQPSGTLTLASSGGSVQLGSGTTLTVDGTLNASSTSATILGAGPFTFKVGSTASARPTLNISGLAVQGTDGDGMQINVVTGAATTFTHFDNVAFSGIGGTRTQYLKIDTASALYLTASGLMFGVGDTTIATYAVALSTSGAVSARVVLGGATCATAKTSGTTSLCVTNWKSDNDSDLDGVPTGGGAVVQFVQASPTDTAGTIEGFPVAAFDWNTYAYYSTYATFHSANGTLDRVYVRRQDTAAARYYWEAASGETIIGTLRYTTEGPPPTTGTHYVYVAVNGSTSDSGKIYRLVDTGTLLVADTTGGWSSLNPAPCSCTIATPLAIDSASLYWGGPASSTQRVWRLTQSSPTGLSSAATSTGSSAITNAVPAQAASGGVTYLMLGLTGHVLKVNAASMTTQADNASPGSSSVYGRIGVASGRVFAGDDGGRMWALDLGTNFASTPLWRYPATGSTDAIKSSSFYDYTNGVLMFGTEGGKVIAVYGSTGLPLPNYPYTPGTAGDHIRSALLYVNGVLAVGTTTGKLFFIDRSEGSATGGLLRQYEFGPTESVSGIGYDSITSRYMVTTADPTVKDGRLYYIDAIADNTPGSP